jgi:hypothetical protein
MSLTAILILLHSPMMALTALVVAGNWETLEQWEARSSHSIKYLNSMREIINEAILYFSR